MVHLIRDARVSRVDYVGLAPRLRTDRLRKVRSALLGYAHYAVAILQRPDLVHIHTSRGGDFWRNVPLVWAATLVRVPVILHVHPADAFAKYVECGPSLLRRVKLATVNAARLVVVPSQVGVRAIDDSPVDARVARIPNPIELRQYRNAPLDQRTGDVVYLGWLIREKGVEDLIAVVPQLYRAVPTMNVRMYGPYGADRMREAAEQLGVRDVVTTGEWIEGEDKAELLGRARVLVLASYTEGQPVVLLEAMASGTPCVATAVGGIPELLEDGATGYLVRAGDREALRRSITALLTDDDLWQRLSAAATVSARRYDASVVVTQVVDEYERVVTEYTR